jgi:hypothetical protein
MSSHVNASTDGVWQWLRSHTNLVDISRAYYEEIFGAVSQEHIYGDNVMSSFGSVRKRKRRVAPCEFCYVGIYSLYYIGYI